METLSQKEFLESVKSGQKQFDGVLMQFFEVPDCRLHGIVIRNSRLFFCNFYDCVIEGIRFEDCSFYYASFYSGKASGMVFEKCDIEQMLFDNFQFEKTSFKNCNIRWSGILNSNFKNVDLSTSVQFKFFTDVSEVSQEDLDVLIKDVMKNIERLDVSTRLKIKQLIRQDLERYNLPDPQEEKAPYLGGDRQFSDAPLSYGEVKMLVESSFRGYKEKKPYEMKKPYQTESKYR